MPSTLLSQTFPGSPSGMNQAIAANAIGDDQAVWIQDGLVDIPSLIRRRGPVQAISSIAQPTRPVHGIVTTVDPQGNARYGLVNGTASNGYFSVYNAAQSALTDIALPYGLPSSPPSSPYPMVQSTPGINGGAFIGISSTHDSGAQQALAYWMGGISASYTTGTISTTGASKTVTGVGTGWTAGVTPGMWIFGNVPSVATNTLIGCVYSVNSDTSITLVDPSPYTTSGISYNTQAIRGVYPRVTTGRITCSTSAATINGGQTKFLKQQLNTGVWLIYRQSDWAYVGTVSTVQSDIALTCTSNCNTAMADDAYVAIRGDASWSMDLANTPQSRPGWMTATYAQRQWFLNLGDSHEDTYRLTYTDVFDAEAYDLSLDGTWTPVNSETVVQEAGRGIAAAYNALVLFKENETFALTGGDPANYAIAKISDDGVLGTGSIQQYGGGVIWAGRNGVHFYDGVQVSNLTEASMGTVWQNSVKSFNPAEYRMGSFIARNHYVLYIENLIPSVTPTKGVTPETQTSWVVVIDLTTMALTMATNLGIRSSIVLPATSGYRVWYTVNDATKGYVCTTDDLFDSTGADVITCQNCTVGPDFFYESKKFDSGDSLRLKRFRLLMLNYMAEGDGLKVDNVPGLNEFGIPQTQTFPETVFTWDTLVQNLSSWNLLKTAFPTWNGVVNSIFLPSRIRFGMDTQFYSFRVYQNSNSVTTLKLGPFSIGYKVMREGRI